MVTPSEPRGLRNNNPGNIRFNPTTHWVGLTGADDAGFCRFDTPYHGLRAMARILRNYQLAGYRSLNVMASRWAPKEDGNNPTEYATVVALHMGPKVDIFQELPLDRSTLAHIVAGFVVVENGGNPYDYPTILSAVDAAIT